MKIAMIAHDNKKIEMLNFVRSFEDIIKQHEIVASVYAIYYGRIVASFDGTGRW